MPIYHGIQVSSDQLKSYKTQDLDYKTQAREIVCERLGYEPPVELSVFGELCIRSALKRFDNGEFSKEDLDKKIEFHTGVVNTVMLEYANAGSC